MIEDGTFILQTGYKKVVKEKNSTGQKRIT
jgi:hypothetical protein